VQRHAIRLDNDNIVGGEGVDEFGFGAIMPMIVLRFNGSSIDGDGNSGNS
jgi:hypothetical protein